MSRIAALVLAASLTGAGGYALAQNASSPPTPDKKEQADAPRGSRFGKAELDSFTDARVAAIQAGLKLTPEQQKLWPPVEQAIRARASERIERMENRRENREERRAGGDRPDFMERLDRRAERVTERAKRVTELQSALKPLWATLDERQKRVLPVLMRAGGGMYHAGRMHHGRMGHHGGMGHHGRDGGHMGRGEQRL